MKKLIMFSLLILTLLASIVACRLIGAPLRPCDASATWTAISAIVTAVTAIVAIVLAMGWFESEPKIQIDWEKINEFHDWHCRTNEQRREVFWLRLPLCNHGKANAKNVEVFVNRISNVIDQRRTEQRKIIPFRLKWTHTDEIRGDIGKEDGMRLIELGNGTSEERKIDLDGDFKASPFELPWLQLFAPGEFEVELWISAENAKPVLETLRIKVGSTFKEPKPTNEDELIKTLPLPSTMAEQGPLATISKTV